MLKCCIMVVMSDMETKRIKISEYVASLRLKEGATIRQFAENHGISVNLAFRYENGDVDCPSYNVAAKFCKIFKIPKNEFSSDFYYKDRKIKIVFDNEENIRSRVTNYFPKDGTQKLIQKFFDENRQSYQLDDLILLKDRIEDNKYGIWHEATCKTRNGELVWIGPITFLLGDSAPIFGQNFSYIAAPINYIALLDSSELPDNCKNYLFFIPNKACFNFLRETKYNSSRCVNNVIIYYVDRKTFRDKAVLFGEDFLIGK